MNGLILIELLEVLLPSLDNGVTQCNALVEIDHLIDHHVIILLQCENESLITYFCLYYLPRVSQSLLQTFSGTKYRFPCDREIDRCTLANEWCNIECIEDCHHLYKIVCS